MSEILFQKITKWGNELMSPYDPESQAMVAGIAENRIITMNMVTKDAIKQRSKKQFNLFHAALRVVAHNAFDRNWNTLEKAKFSLKIELEYYDRDKAYVLPDGTVILEVRSFGYKSLPHMEANDVFNRSWPILADVIGITENKLLEAARNREY